MGLYVSCRIVDIDVLSEVADGSVLGLREEVPRDLDDPPVLGLVLLDHSSLDARHRLGFIECRDPY